MSRKDRRAAGTQGGGTAGTTLFTRAVQHHQSGQLLEAEMLYREVLAADRRHFGSLHHLGIIALQRGQPQAAVEALGRAIAVNDRVPDCRYNMAFALQAIGRLQDAVEHYRAAVKLKPDYVEAHTNLGNVLTRLGNHGEAAACYERVIALKPTAEAHCNLGNSLASLGRLNEAITQYQRALTLKPDLTEAHNNLANALAAQSRASDALVHFERALQLNPNLMEAHVSFGAALLQLGKLDAAAGQLQRALGINPNFAAAHSNLGNVLLAQGRLDEAAQCYERALAVDPGIAEAHNNLGIVLMARGDPVEASRRFQLALERKSDFVDACNNLARALLSMGQPVNALGALRRALTITETKPTKSLFVQCAGALAEPPDVDEFRALLIRALSEPWGRGNDLARVGARVVKQDDVIKACVARAAAAWPERLSAEALLGRDGLAPIAGHHLLRCLMETAVICDSELERFLTAIRFAMSDAAASDDFAGDETALDFCCALARQCFLNEYVFDHTDDELARVQRLRDSVIAALSSDGPVSELQLATVASYFPLHSLPGSEALLARDWPEAVASLVGQQVREPRAEQQLQASLPSLTAIDDETSHKVQHQYEQNPYPRWQKADPVAETVSFDEYLRRRLPAANFAPLGKPHIDVLIAGCGSGQHSVETAQRFAGAKVLALDLSRTSLAYAKRKTLELGLGNIEYAQADILNLGPLGRSFDLIESSGVLHHLADPLAGWRVLVALLRPGGFMTIGLYSEIARTGIVAARELIAARGLQPTGADIRRCRQDMLAESRFANVTTSVDFFSTSGCRDLLFHVQEHRLTIPQIAAFLAANGLAFLGFDLEPVTTQRYLARFPHDKTMTDLGSWDAFERDNPATFSGMYQFWVQKRP